MLPDVSVVIPSHNYARYLPETIESIRDQPHINIEIVLVDDGSTDDSVAVARRLLGKNDQLIELTKNHRHSPCNADSYMTRNEGIIRASAPRIVCLDADDMLTYQSLVLRCVALTKHHGFVTGRSYKLPMEKDKILTYADCCQLALGKELGDLEIPLRWRKKPNRVKSMQMSTLVCWADLYRKYGLYDEQLPGWNDRECWQRWLNNGEHGAFIERHVSFRRMHKAQITKSEQYQENNTKMIDMFLEAVEMRKKDINPSNTPMRR